MRYDVTLHNTPRRTALARRGKTWLETLDETIRTLTASLYPRAERHRLIPSGPPEVAYLSAFAPDVPLLIEARLPVAGAERLRPGHQAPLVTLPPRRCASTVHHGAYDGIGAAYRALEEWVVEHRQRPVGPPTETYLVGPGETDRVAEYRTEISIPVAG
ncbi:GyrI-like domain-containing protein [Prauserella muralis]|uniref:AraC effector-binding domain-containing protein n=1 Tax=Prauserella muralis TaxID=588067 RepID=A0A2V4AQD6_9PSEU|nr:GyrI-like domain-containing protein [Prauserella muralis]PXY22234.1 hypothetical protein BAY60_20325 [Prauserella muralis]